MGQVAGRFTRVEPRRRMRKLVLGLLSDLPRKNCWTIAEWAGETTPGGMQHLLGRAKWDADQVRDDVRGYVVEHLGGGQQHLVHLALDQREGGPATTGQVGEREAADQQGPLVDLAGEQRAESVVAAQPPGEDDGDDQLGRLGGERGQPLHQQEAVDAERGAGVNQGGGEGLGAGEDHAGHDREDQHGGGPAAASRQGGQPGRDADEFLLVVLAAAADPEEVVAVPGDQDGREQPGDLPGQRHHEGQQGGRAEGISAAPVGTAVRGDF
ncbi:transposase [Kitasatospora sp. MAA19]|uniref:transposase n=1 Tax=Kitasatospora sp. MAA19 TaxID=3035090 RepID=UPI0024739433|nr:transposase [Kitasatospora sp. MAA19]